MPPLTGGKTASSSPSSRRCDAGTYAAFTAKRTGVRASSGRSATIVRHTAPTVLPAPTSRSPPPPRRSRSAAKNRTRTRTALPAHQIDHVPELGQEELLHRQLDRRPRPRNRDDDLAARDAGRRAR